MNLIECIKMAFISMKANKMRSFLTMLGIIIGVSSVITISTIGNTIEKNVRSVFFNLGMNQMQIYVDYRDYESEVMVTDADKITDEMMDGLFKKYPGRFELFDSRSYTYGTIINDNNDYLNANITGIYSGYMKYNLKTIIKGRNITELDNQKRMHTAVVSEAFEKIYCEDDSIIGKTIKISSEDKPGISVTVVGVYKDSKNMKLYNKGKRNIDTEIYVPYNTVSYLEGDTDNSSFYKFILFNTDYDPIESEKLIVSYFDRLYKDNENFYVDVYSIMEEMDIISVIVKVLSLAFSVIGAISLIVGGVGVMNIMLVSVVERTSEIGIRKALGAKSSSIKRQFVTEAIIICIIGGSLGVLLGIGGSYLICEIAKMLIPVFAPDQASLINITFEPSVTAIIISVVCSVLIGVIFGSSPAKRAAKMNPIDALRYE